MAQNKPITMNVADILISSELQARAGINQDHVADLREVMGRPKGKFKTPRVIEVLDRGGQVYAIDQHRIVAYKQEGRKKATVIKLIGTWQDARDLASSSNVEHNALTRTREDKRRAVMMYLEDHPTASDAMAADHCKVSPGFVADWRPKVEKAAAVPPQERISKIGVKRKYAPKIKPQEPVRIRGADDPDRFDGILNKIVSLSREINEAINSEGGENLLKYLTQFKLIVYPQDKIVNGEKVDGEPKFRGFPGLRRVIRFAALPGRARSAEEVQAEYDRTTED